MTVIGYVLEYKKYPGYYYRDSLLDEWTDNPLKSSIYQTEENAKKARDLIGPDKFNIKRLFVE